MARKKPHPRPVLRSLPALALLVAPVLLLSCLGRSTHTETDTGDEKTYSTSFSVLKTPEEALLERGRQAVMDGNFSEAATFFTRVYDNTNAKSNTRAEGLYELGLVHSHILNPQRNEAKAVEVFRKLVNEFPQSPLKAEAEKKIAQLAPEG